MKLVEIKWEAMRRIIRAYIKEFFHLDPRTQAAFLRDYNKKWCFEYLEFKTLSIIYRHRREKLARKINC